MTSPSDAVAVRSPAATWVAGQLARYRPAAVAVRDRLAEVDVSPILGGKHSADLRAAQIDALQTAVRALDDGVSPIRSRIHELRTELAKRVASVLEPADAKLEEARRVLGAWRAQDRLRQEAATVAARLKAASAETPTEMVEILKTAPQVTAAKGTRRTWLVEVTDDAALHGSLLALAHDLGMQGKVAKKINAETCSIETRRGVVECAASLRPHLPALRKALRGPEGAHLIEMASLRGVQVRSEDKAT